MALPPRPGIVNSGSELMHEVHTNSSVLVSFSPSTASDPETLVLDEESLPPSYEFTIEQTILPTTTSDISQTTAHRSFRPPPLNQLTFEDAHNILDSADVFWSQGDWAAARTRYTTASAIFHVVEDMRNEAFCLQRLGEVCRIMCDYAAARAHIWQAHVLFGRCGEIARQLMCERWLARVASDEGMIDEARLLLHAALDNSRIAGLRESEGWCLLRLGELDGMNKDFIQQALEIAQDEKIMLLESRCISATSRQQKQRRQTSVKDTTVCQTR
jgi:hypothetical protein